MSERLTTCPSCNSTHVLTVKIHNPDTHDMNANATLKCGDCGHEWEGRVTSPYMEEQRSNGWVI